MNYGITLFYIYKIYNYSYTIQCRHLTSITYYPNNKYMPFKLYMLSLFS